MLSIVNIQKFLVKTENFIFLRLLLISTNMSLSILMKLTLKLLKLWSIGLNATLLLVILVLKLQMIVMKKRPITFWMGRGAPHRSIYRGYCLRCSLFIFFRAIIKVVHNYFWGSKHWIKICGKCPREIIRYLRWKPFTPDNE